jgi:hypothetical protein
MTVPTEPTLPERMRLAADTIDEANTRIGGPTNGYWRPSELRKEADEVDAEDREAAEKADQVEVLSKELFTANYQNKGKRWDAVWPDVKEIYHRIANTLIESGWRKDGAA